MSPIQLQTIEFSYPYYIEYGHIQKLLKSQILYNIRKLIFNAGHNGAIKHIMTVADTNRHTIADALYAAEKWLLEPLPDDEYITLHNNWDLEYMDPTDRPMYCLRGDCLGKSKIITDIKIDADGTLYIISDS